MNNQVKYDLVEDSEEYKKIEEELEKKINILTKVNDNQKGLGYCHIYWEYKKMILKRDYNIDWKSPAELNPDIIFD